MLMLLMPIYRTWLRVYYGVKFTLRFTDNRESPPRFASSESSSFRAASAARARVRVYAGCDQSPGRSILRRILDQRDRPSVKISLTFLARSIVRTQCEYSGFSKVARRKDTRAPDPSNCRFTASREKSILSNAGLLNGQSAITA